MKQANPLEMPEIVTMVGHCLPLWKYSERLGFYDFNPSKLLKCTLVSKTWYNALTPVIWYIYNEFVMRSVPKEVIIKNSRHFRVFFHDRSFTGPFESIHLKALSISWWDETLLPLIEGNAESLENLVWKGSYLPQSKSSSSPPSSSSSSPTRTTTLSTSDYNLLMRMGNSLQQLQLSHWTISGQKFIEFLSVCKCLTRLELTAIDWVDPAPPKASPSSSPSPPARDRSTSPVSPLFPPSSPLSGSVTDAVYHQEAGQGITDLQLDISVSKPGAFTDLVQSCPDLVNISLYSEDTQDPRTLIPVLRGHCPKLSGIEYVLRFSSALGGYDYLSDSEYSDLILSSRQLRSLKLDIPWLDNAMVSALMMQSSTLESLSLKFQMRRSMPMKDAENICKILKHCIRLKNLALIFNPEPLGREETLRLFDEPWKCLELETLELSDVTMTTSIMGVNNNNLNNNNDGEQQPYLNNPLQPFHWRIASASSAVPDSGMRDRSAQFCSLGKLKLFNQVRELPKLGKLSLNHVTYRIDNCKSK
ncbi:hypothetical protein BGZ46_002912 [Entomortierella lignicola]|nr:hypothetical protein BGZ46_002912 [Entomortierella lignicola]